MDFFHSCITELFTLNSCKWRRTRLFSVFFFFKNVATVRPLEIAIIHRFAIAREELPCRFERSLAWLACERSGRAWEVGYL